MQTEHAKVRVQTQWVLIGKIQAMAASGIKKVCYIISAADTSMITISFFELSIVVFSLAWFMIVQLMLYSQRVCITFDTI